MQIIFPIVTASQAFSDTQKTQARTNIGAASGAYMGNTVHIGQQAFHSRSLTWLRYLL